MSQKQPKPVGGRVQMNRRSLLKSALAVAAGNALWVPRIAKAATEIPIGVVVGLTGAGADYGRDALRAFQLVVDRVNRNGGIKAHGGAKVVLHIADHQTDLRVTSSETERLITRQNVLAILGWAASGSARVGSQVSERYSVPSIDTSVDYKLTERGLKYFYRAAINTRQTCERGVEFVAEMEKTSGVPVKRVMILHEDLAYGTGAGDIFQAAIERIGRWELVDRVAYTASKLTEATGIVNKIKALNVDVVFQASYPADGILIQRAMKQLRLNLFANVHPAGAPPNLQYVESLKDDANFVITVLGWTPNMTGRLPAGAKATVAEYNKRYNAAIQDQAGYSLSAVAAMIAALEQARSLDREAIWAAIDKIDVSFGQDPNVIIPFGVKWDEKHDNAKAQPVVTQILDRELVVVSPKDLAGKAPAVPPPRWEERG
jgi:branched-chain amino acid transport system substrate-binding protein